MLIINQAATLIKMIKLMINIINHAQLVINTNKQNYDVDIDPDDDSDDMRDNEYDLIDNREREEGVGWLVGSLLVDTQSNKLSSIALILTPSYELQ